MDTIFYITGCIAAVLLLFYHGTKNFNYWKKKKVPYPTPIPVFGNCLEYILLKKCLAKVNQELCQRFPNEPYFGIFFGTEPALVILDPEVIKLVFTKEFYYFNSRELQKYSNKELNTQNLFFQHGDTWKVIRSNLTPLFSSAKMRNMFYLIEKCAHTFEDMLDRESTQSEVLGARNLMIRYTLDSFCSCGFGIEANTMDPDSEQNPLMMVGRNIFNSSYHRGFTMVTRQIWPHLFYGFGLKSFPTEVYRFFSNLLEEVFENRGHKPTSRNDFIDIMLNLKKNKILVGDSLINTKTGGSKKVEVEMDNELIISQSIVFFAAGFETSASALSLTLYELAKNKDAQKRAQKEIDDYLQKNDNKLNYDCVVELPFLEACVNETLRLYPVLPIITREVVEGYTFPSGLHLEAGSRVHLPVYHIHHDPKNFRDPEQYKPERFLSEAMHEIKPYTYFPFGEGPRTCIGKRFAKMQSIPGLITFLKKFSVELADDAPQTLDFETTTLLLQPTSSLPVKVTRRDGWENRVYTR